MLTVRNGFGRKSAAIKGIVSSVDARRKTDKSENTFQITFRGGDDFASRYVVAVNAQGSAMLRRFYNGENEELALGGYEMTDKFAHVVIEVNGSKMTLLIDGKEILNYTDSEITGQVCSRKCS